MCIKKQQAFLGASIVVTLLAAGFIAASTVRQLNFDEWLVLRSGWLLQNNYQTELHFLMPYTWLCGLVANHISVTACILTLRLLVACTVLFALFWTFKQVTKDRMTAFLSMFICLTSGAFVSHAFEFRYDAVILCCWIFAWGLKVSPSSGRYAALGIIAGILACHHLKGVFFSVSLLTIVLFSILFSESPTRRRDTALFVACTSVFLLVWLACLNITGLVGEQLSFFNQFFSLGHQDNRVWLFDALGRRLLADLQWWEFVVICCAINVWRWKPELKDLTTLGMAIIPLIFIVIHPRPWDYMLAPSIPFFSVGAALGLVKLWKFAYTRILAHGMSSRRQALLVYTCMLLLLLMPLTGISSYKLAFNKSYHDEVALLASYQKVARNEDTVLDPTGTLYFARPFDKAWYLDILFRPSLEDYQWMIRTLETGEESTLVVNSYRKNWLPKDVLLRLQESHVPACGWLWLRKGDTRLEKLRDACPAGQPPKLTNYWGY